jgi:hypothetical protein
MVWNIPLALQSYAWDAEKKALRWEVNPDFVATTERWAQPDDVLLVTCRSGGRSAMAINALAGAGFTKAYNIIDGMEGGLVDDPSSVFHGMRMKNGWRNSGLPWTYELDRERLLLPPRESGELHPDTVD